MNIRFTIIASSCKHIHLYVIALVVVIGRVDLEVYLPCHGRLSLGGMGIMFWEHTCNGHCGTFSIILTHCSIV
jgi:hypothetical protein